MSKILIISSNIHQDLSAKQLNRCVELVKTLPYDYEVEILEAGSYEIPFVISAYHKKRPFAGYIALGLLLNTNPYHYDYITSHIKLSFSHFALNNVVVGNGIISGASIEELTTRIESGDPCMSGYASAVKAVDCLIRLNEKI